MKYVRVYMKGKCIGKPYNVYPLKKYAVFVLGDYLEIMDIKYSERGFSILLEFIEKVVFSNERDD